MIASATGSPRKSSAAAFKRCNTIPESSGGLYTRPARARAHRRLRVNNLEGRCLTHPLGLGRVELATD